MRPMLALACQTLAILFFVVAQVVSIGYFLYNWGALDTSIGVAAGAAFVVWMKMVGTAIVLATINAVAKPNN